MIAAITALVEPEKFTAAGPDRAPTSDAERPEAAQRPVADEPSEADEHPARSTEHHGQPARSAEQRGQPARSAEHREQPEPDSLATRRADALLRLITGQSRVETDVVVVIDTGQDATTASAHIQDGPAIPVPTAERLGCAARVRALVRDRHGNPLHLGRTRRFASPAQLTALHIRDQARCQFPGCECTHNLHAHRIVHWLRGGHTDITNLVLICGRHHRLIHDHGYHIRGSGTNLTFHRPNGRPIDPTGAPTAGSLDALIRQTDTSITDDTITPSWTGEPLDLTAALASLLPEHPCASAA